MQVSASTRSEVHNPSSTELAVERTWLAHERTLMAWVRTATFMISFGFTIYKFFQFEQGSLSEGGADGLGRVTLHPRGFFDDHRAPVAVA
jgi:uncharacterized membrane protein YidH (DUF202 family)